MAYLQSPGVQVIEKDASAVTVGTSSTVGATVGVFKWGPVMNPMLISNEAELVSTFGKPDDATFGSFFAAANFLSYTNAMYVVRADTTNFNAAVGSAQKINNLDAYDAVADWSAAGVFAARYPGVLGNSIKVSIADAGTWSVWPAAFKDQFQSAPGTSDYATSVGGSNDELHIVVIDKDGKISGTAGTVLEVFPFVSKATDAISASGLSNYWVNVLRNQSSYVYSTGKPTGGTNWNTSAVGTAFTSLTDTDVSADGYVFTYQLVGGIDDNAPTDGELQAAWSLLVNKESYDVSLLVAGNVNNLVAKYIGDYVSSVRKDCVAFVSLNGSDTAVSPVLSTNASKNTLASDFKTDIGNNTYAVIDSGYKYMYDKYNDKYRWVALNADTAGLCAKVDQNQATWFSPAGLTKGQIKGAIKLSWNPTQADRDLLYKLSINPVVSFAGQGTLLYGDKTATSKPSAFDRINVRRLFITLEKSIEQSARYQLFELNDEITRQLFIASVEPFLRDIQGRRGIDAFKVICDATNNTPQIVQTNQFVGTILVRPIYSINFITLNFTAVGSQVSFDTAAQV